MKLFWTLVALVSFATTTAAQDAPEFIALTLDDGALQVGPIEGNDISFGSDGKTDVLLVERSDGAVFDAAVPHLWLVSTTSGERFVGRLVSADDAGVKLAAEGVGVLELSLDEIVAISKASARINSFQQAIDRLVLRNGDTAEGFFAGLDDEGRFLLDTDADRLEIEADRVAGLVLAEGAASEPNDATVAVLLTDRSLIRAQEFELAGDRFRLVWQDRVMEGLAKRVLAVEPLGMQTVWVADLEPTSVTHAPFFTATHPPRIGRGLASSFDGDDLPSRSVTLRPSSTLTYEVPSGVTRLRGGVSILADASRPYADVAVRVLVDDGVAFEQESLTSDAGVVLFDVDLDGAETISLIVDFGGNLGVQDDVLFLRPILLP
ncbi:MAG: NPCBM/NEW2 domain-containing protein [Planctomycetota bacterium]